VYRHASRNRPHALERHNKGGRITHKAYLRDSMEEQATENEREKERERQRERERRRQRRMQGIALIHTYTRHTRRDGTPDVSAMQQLDD